MTDVTEQVTVRPGEEDPPPPTLNEERGLTSEPTLSAMQSNVSEDTIDEKLRYAIADAFGEKPEFSGRFCAICNDTTAHFRPRGKAPDYVKTVSWMCTPCFMPGGKLYQTVRRLMVRQGEIAS